LRQAVDGGQLERLGGVDGGGLGVAHEGVDKGGAAQRPGDRVRAAQTARVLDPFGPSVAIVAASAARPSGASAQPR
jgi:hypothetical protein